MTREELKKFEPLWDKWYIQEHLGSGSYGDVYRITCQVYERTYEAALKIISIPRDKAELNDVEMSCETKEDTISYYDRIRQSITSEIDMMEQLKGHTNIVSFEDHDIIPHNQGRDPGYDIFIRMELLEDFSSVIGKESKQWRDNRQVVKLGMDIAEGLRVCHSHNIIHRDIKLGNIFRSKDGDFKIGDFGIARNASDAQLTMSMKGTFNYMAPEVYNREHYDFRADIYSLGMVMYYMLNKNRGPFLSLAEVPTAQEKETALIQRMRGEKMNPPLMAKKGLADIILKACEYRMEDRYQTMAEFYQALSQLSEADAERPEELSQDSDVVNNSGERTVVPEEEGTVAFVEPAKENTPIELHRVDDDRTIAMEMTGMQPENKPIYAFEQTGYENYHQPVTNKKNRKWIYAVIVGMVLAVFGTGAGIIGYRVVSDQFAAAESGKTESGNLGQETAENSEEALETSEAVQGTESGLKEWIKEVTAKASEPVEPYCCEAVSVKGEKKSGGLVFEGDRLEKLTIDGNFQASEKDSAEVTGTLKLDNAGEKINKSGDYTWTFTPDDTEHYKPVSGKVFITAVHKELVDGLDELKEIEDKKSVYQLSLTDCGLKDLSVLKGMTNLAVLVVSNNEINDISEISNLPNLQQIYLDGNKDLKNVQSLYGLKKLQILELDGTSVSDKDKKKLKKQMSK